MVNKRVLHTLICFSCLILKANSQLPLWDNLVDSDVVQVVKDELTSRTVVEKPFEPTWESLDKRTLPSWYEDAKFGIFMHWGVYSVPAFKSEWFWWHWKGDRKSEYSQYMKENFPTYSYQDLAPKLTGKHFNPDDIASLVEDSGAKYFVFTSKHHEGFTHWKSEESWNWNSVDIGPKRDIIDELKGAFAQTNVTFGLYFSLYEWFNPWYKKDKKNEFTTQEFVEKKIRHQLRDIVEKYKPLYIWSDGDWEAQSEYWNSTNFLAWLYNESPVKDDIVVNDRWGKDANCVHGDVKTCKDRYNPGKKLPFKWENAMTIDRESWGYRSEATLSAYISSAKLIETLIETVSCGGNLLMNIGPTADGRIIPIYEERLRDMGKWLKINGEAIYGTRPWRIQKDPTGWKVWYTTKFNRVYAHMCRWPKNRYLRIRSPIATTITKVKLLGYDGDVKWEKQNPGLKIDLHQIPAGELPSNKAWVFVLENVK
ncbi:tissue alpha-L-fucosidase-like [Hydractinia symbiolongicarpus]|uniref:tissue alpha-L-fucosidase-like n=1 Tax=Hydractinia symbiolongicarpus TaxID=13093 RepID=UPI00254D5BB9|nr:tissue alpha-L-fucosidase-like [Hydractinia symbiolongicarpus]